MNLRILNLRQSSEWSDALERFDRTDIYFLPEYHKAYELNGDGEAHAFIAESGNKILFYPFIIRPIDRVGSHHLAECWYDLETVYGYTGPLANTEDQDFLAEAWREFSNWCRDMRIIAEFIRFNPLTDSHKYAGTDCCLTLDRNTVAVKLDCSEEDLWSSYPSSQRTELRKAFRHGLACLEVPLAQNLDSFRRLYAETMNRVTARSYYYFSDEYFGHLCSALGERTKLFVVFKDGLAVAGAVFFLHDRVIHYHLSGTDDKHRQFSPNNLLLHTVASWGRERGYRWLHLGGGRSADKDDSLFRFKASISNHRFPFYTAKRLHNQLAHEELCSEWMRQSGRVERPPYFLLYRLEINA